MRSEAAASREHARPAAGQRHLDKRCIDTIRTLAIDAVGKANSGHAGTPMALAPVAYTLWQRFLRYDPSDPLWPNRDRFVLSAGHASMLLYALLHLAGVRRVEAGRVTENPAVTLDDIKNFRQLDSVTPGHPEFGRTTGIETTTGPLGQGCGNSVGMAIASRWLGARYNQPNATLFDFRVYTICSDGDLMEGVASEAASLAGHLQLSNLCWIYDSNTVTIEGHTDLAMSEDVATRFKGYRWNVVRLADANDTAAFAQAVEIFLRTEDQPTLIIVNSIIGYGAPHKQNTAAAHSDALGEEEVRLAKRFYGWPEDAQFLVPDGVYDSFRKGIGRRGRGLRDDWMKIFTAYKDRHSELAREVELLLAGKLPEHWDRDLATFPPDEKGLATRDASGKMLNAIAQTVPWHGLGDRVEHLARCVARRETFLVRRKGRQVAIPMLRQFAGQQQLDFARQLRMPIFVRRKYFHPVVAQAAPAAADAFAERVVHAIRHEELRIFRPAIEPLCQPDFLLAEGIAVRCRGVLLVRGAVADDAVDDD